MKMEQIECSETSAYIIQTPGNYPKENIIYSEQGESLKSRIVVVHVSIIILWDSTDESPKQDDNMYGTFTQGSVNYLHQKLLQFYRQKKTIIRGH